IIVVDYNTYIPPSSSSAYTYDDSLGAYVKAPIYLSREELKWTLNEEDSIVWLNNNKLLRYTTTNFQFINDYTIKEHSDTKTLRNFDIYNLVYKNKFPEEKAKLEREFNAIADKYRTGDSDDDYSYWNNSIDPTGALTSSYGLWEINHSIDNVGDRLYRWEDESLAISIRSALYISLFLSLCVFIFRHCTVKTFFLSILTGILIAIISGIIMVLLDFQEEGVLGALIVYFVFFLVFALCTVQQKVRSVFSGIALNLAVVMTPFFPIICVACYHELNHSNLFYDPDYLMGPGSEHYKSTYMLHLQIAEIFGFIILLIMIETVYKWMFRKWYAAPVE
ncbi:MAG TPA: hypothetical protein VK826_09435, partial [Bacteroidia bacterium]|nr:hypothetical protein [Bacteroidia bacterium]